MQRSKIFVFLTALVLLLVSTQGVYAKNYANYQTITANHDWFVYMPINSGDHIEGNFTVGGAFSNTVYFSITNPQGERILDLGSVGDTQQFSFNAQSTGTYTLNFSNPYPWDTDLSLHVQTPEQTTSISPTPQTASAPVEPYLFGGFTALILVLVIAFAIYAFAKRGAPNKLTGQEKEIKILEGKMTFALLGAGLGLLLLSSAFTYLYTPYYFWATVLPDAVMQTVDPIAGLIAVMSLIFLFAGFAVLFAMIALLGYYGRKLKRIRTQTPPIQSNPQNNT